MAKEVKIKITAENRELLSAINGAVARLRSFASSVTGLGNVNIGTDKTVNNLEKVKEKTDSAASSIKGLGSAGSISFNTASKSAGTFSDSISSSIAKVAGLIYIVKSLGDMITSVIKPGFDFSKSMETNQIGMAGILQSMTLIDGKAVDFNQAMAISSDMMKKLQQDALRTAASTEDLVNVFRAILSPGLNAGMTLDQIRQLTVVGTNAVKSLGVPAQQVVQEMRDLVQGGITASGSTLATALGITDADIKKAKQSSEGLFVFLLERMQGFKDTAEKFPDTMNGKIDQLKETFTMASASFSDRFEGPIKEGLQEITDLIGNVNQETGKFEINPAIIGVLDDIESGLSNIRDLSKEVKAETSDTFDNLISSAGKAYQVMKDLGNVWIDLQKIQIRILSPLLNEIAYEANDLAGDVVWLSGKIKELFNIIARKVGAKPDNVTPTGMGAFQQMQNTNDLLPVSTYENITPKYPGNQDNLITVSQQAMKMAFDQIDAEATEAIDEIKRKVISLEQKKDQMNVEEYNRQMAEFKVAENTIPVIAAQRKYEVVENTGFKTQEEQNVKLAEMQKGIDNAQSALVEFRDGLDDVNNLISQMDWQNIDNHPLLQEAGQFKDIIVDAAQRYAISPDLLAAVIKKESSFNPDVTSLSGAMGLAQLMPDTASSLGVKNPYDAYDSINGGAKYLAGQLQTFGGDIASALAAYNAGPEAVKKYGGIPPYGETQDYVATITSWLGDNPQGLTTYSTFEEQVKQKLSGVLTKTGKTLVDDILAVYQKYDEIVAKLAELRGDDSVSQKAALEAKYREIVKLFNNNFQGEVLNQAIKDVENVVSMQENRIDFSQVQKNLEIVNAELVESQEKLINELADGSKSEIQVTQEYVDKYKEKTSSTVENLRNILVKASTGDTIDTDLQIKIKSLLKQIADSANKIVEVIIKRIDDGLQFEIAKINSNHDMTKLQKEEAIDAATRKAYARRADLYEENARQYREISPELKKKLKSATGFDADVAAMSLEKQAALNRELAKTQTLLDQVHETSKQAFEDGLLTFLTDGVTKCATLGEAFRNLALTVVNSIQQVYAKALTSNIMKALGLTTTSPYPTINGATVIGPLKADGSFAEGGELTKSGVIKGPGTSTSDSIMAYVANLGRIINISNAEGVLTGKAMHNIGTSALEALNAGVDPRRIFKSYAIGGSLTDSVSNLTGPQDIAATLSSGDTNLHLKMINVSDSDDIGRYVQSRSGEKVLINWIKNHAMVTRQILSLKG